MIVRNHVIRRHKELNDCLLTQWKQALPLTVRAVSRLHQIIHKPLETFFLNTDIVSLVRRSLNFFGIIEIGISSHLVQALDTFQLPHNKTFSSWCIK